MRPKKAAFQGRLRHRGETNAGAIRKRHQMHPPFREKDNEGYIRWTLRSLPYPRIHSAPVKDFYSNKIAGDGSVAADECTYKCKYCVLIYSNN